MKNIILIIKNNYKLVLGVFIVGLLFGWIFFHSSNEATLATTEVEGHEGHGHETAAQIWTCSMHPQIKMDKPGKCPICSMDLIPLTTVSDESEDTNPNAIVMSEAARKMAEIQTIIVSKGSPKKSVYLQGKVRADERNIAELTARFGGRIEKLFINFTGQEVQKGEKLATIYSPELVTAQRELLEAVAYKETRPSLYNAARGKLRLWDLTEKQIDDIEINGKPLLYFDVESPITGTVSMRHVSIGDYVKEGTPLFQVIDLSKLWVMFDAYESDLPWIKLGDKVEFTVQSLPGKNFSASVSYIDPFINGKTRVTQVRVEVSNKEMLLKPEMFTSGILQSVIAQKSHQILIPKSSILWTGKRAVVYVKIPDTKMASFLYREIVLGPEAGAFYLVASGLQEGEEIATNGVFKIDAAAQLQGLPSMMNPEGGDSGAGKMAGMDMGGSITKKSESFTSNEALTNPHSLEKISPKFKKQLGDVYNVYLNMKNAFVETDAAKVKTNAVELAAMLKKVNMGLLKGDNHMLWMDQLKHLEKSIQDIQSGQNIATQRLAFSTFNLAFYKSFKSFGILNNTAYYQYCPMANGEKGAYWFSETKEIRNPYFGDAMLKCGETRETFK